MTPSVLPASSPSPSAVYSQIPVRNYSWSLFSIHGYQTKINWDRDKSYPAMNLDSFSPRSMPCHKKQLSLSYPSLHFYPTSPFATSIVSTMYLGRERKGISWNFSPLLLVACVCPGQKCQNQWKYQLSGGALPLLTSFWRHIWLQSHRKCLSSLKGGSKHHIAWMHCTAPECVWDGGLGLLSLRTMGKVWLVLFSHVIWAVLLCPFTGITP